MRKIKIAQIGTSANSHGNQIWKSLGKQTERFEVVYDRLVNDKNFPIGVLFDWGRV